MKMSTTSTIDRKMERESFEPMLLEHIRVGNDREIWSILGSENPREMSDSSGRTLLHFAAEYGNEKFARYLIDSGADVDAQDQKEQTPLMLAVEADQEKTVRLLLKAGADMFMPDVDGQCALGKALRKRQAMDMRETTAVKAVLDRVTVESLKGSRYVASDVFHRDCPLYQFMHLKNAEVTKVLLEKGSPVDAKDTSIHGHHMNALHLAVRNNCLENVKLLLENHADVNAINYVTGAPLNCLNFLFSQDESITLTIIRLLIDAGAVLTDPVSRRIMVSVALERGGREIVRAVLQLPIDWQFMDLPGRTAYHYLALNKNPGVVEELSHFDFDVNARSDRGLTPLHDAAREMNPNFLKFLLNRGADVNAKSNRGETALFMVTHPFFYGTLEDSWLDRWVKGYSKCREILLEHGADPHVYTAKVIANFVDRSYYYYPGFFHSITNQKLLFIRPVFAKLALLEASGRPIETFTRNFIESYPRLQRAFDLEKQKLDEMKRIKLNNSLTLLDILIFNEDKILQFARNPRNKWLVSKIINITKDFSTTSCHQRKFHQSFSKINHLFELRETFLPVINEVLSRFCGLSLYNIAERIFDYLRYENGEEIV